jgi:uncharacterized membrane protein YphA (DoxX/SURF4 family)
MKSHRFLLFPGGAPGTGLFLLRVSVVIFLASHPIGRFAPASLVSMAFYALAILMGIGLRMRTAAVLTVVVAIYAFFQDHAALPSVAIAHGIDALVLAICGPGALSLDARLFGRTTVRMHD